MTQTRLNYENFKLKLREWVKELGLSRDGVNIKKAWFNQINGVVVAMNGPLIDKLAQWMHHSVSHSPWKNSTKQTHW